MILRTESLSMFYALGEVKGYSGGNTIL